MGWQSDESSPAPAPAPAEGVEGVEVEDELPEEPEPATPDESEALRESVLPPELQHSHPISTSLCALERAATVRPAAWMVGLSMAPAGRRCAS